jgi:hypothetical protein
MGVEVLIVSAFVAKSGLKSAALEASSATVSADGSFQVAIDIVVESDVVED